MKIDCGCSGVKVVIKFLKSLFQQITLDIVKDRIRKILPEPPNQQTVIFKNGTIRTMAGGDAQKTAEAVAISEGKIKKVGTLDECRKRLPGVEEIDLGKKCMLPAFIEPHVHTLSSAITSTWIDVSPFQGQELRQDYALESCLADLKKKSNSDEVKGGWLLAFGLDPSLLQTDKEGINWPEINKDVLDEKVSTTVCVCIVNASCHIAYANTKALEEVYGKDKVKDDEMTGILLELDQMGPVLEPAIAAQAGEKTDIQLIDDLIKNVTAKFTEVAANGSSLMWDGAYGSSQNRLELDILQFLAESGYSPVRLGGALLIHNRSDIGKWEDQHVNSSFYDSEKFRVPFVKLVSDGSNQGLTGYQTTPYSNPDVTINDDHPCGVYNFDDENPLLALIPELVQKGWEMMIHANGDEALNRVIRALTFAGHKRDSRNRIEHCSLATSEDFSVMKEHGISPSFLIGHVGYWGQCFKEKVWPINETDKVMNLDRTKSALDAGLRITLHSDHNVSPLGPLRLMEQAVTRVMESTPNEEVLNKDEAITIEDALRAVTYDAAWQCRMEDWIGQIAYGKCADFVILDEDPMKREAKGLRNVRISETWVDGRKRYSYKSHKK